MKKRMKVKGLALLITLVLLFTSVLGCGTDSRKENAVHNSENTESVEKNDGVIGDNENDDIDTDSEDDDKETEGSGSDADQDASTGNESGDSDNGNGSNGSDNGSSEDSDLGDNSSGNGNSSGDTSAGGNSGGNASDGGSSGSNNSGNGNSNNNGGTTSGSLSAGEQMAKEIVESIITSGMSDFEKAITIHDWITYNIDYDQTYTNYYLEETLRDRTGVCQGYAEAFNSMAKWAGLECVFIGGFADNGSGDGYVGHAWNRVKIDGSWYNVDTTWDDPTWEGKSPNDHTHNGYAYFLVSDAKLNIDHKVEFINGTAGSCPKDYERGAIYKYKIAKEEGNNVIYVDDKLTVLTEIYRQYEAGKNEIVVWCYDDWTTDEITDVFNTIFDGKYGCCVDFVTNDVQMTSTGRLVKYNVTMKISYRDWSAIPMATTNEELNRICEEQVAKGVREVMVRFEPTDPNEMVGFTDWLSKYGILSVWSEYISYNTDKYMLYKFIF